MKRFTLALLLVPLFSTAALATSYTGPGAVTQVTSVAAALKAADDTPVLLQGQIVKRLQDELYEFKDASGTMQAAFSRDETLMRMIMQHDIGLRHLAAVAVLKGVTWAPGS